MGARCKAGCWCLPSHQGQRGVPGLWECPPSASSVLCSKMSSIQPGHALPVPALGHVTIPAARLTPGLSPAHEPSPGRAGRGATPTPSTTRSGMPARPGLTVEPPPGEAPATGRMEICLISTSKSSSSSRGPGSPCQANMFKSNCSFFAPKFTRCFFQTLIKPFCRPPCTEAEMPSRAAATPAPFQLCSCHWWGCECRHIWHRWHGRAQEPEGLDFSSFWAILQTQPPL